ncbi:PRC-barrel domain containing protein [Streptacidiphilus sp. PB12-B1b]|uniref:PRC-barrel domain-containing protein n=1 Tax=Streptacidiphilus sp. PB12-B1b TaxID=2705012 RepID=UPI0015FC5F38|nr:PRC-barrel domain-containing protein [Streptacidiphilus sp. PB12-B1b]QMU77002.1 PRC-barrel domain containing protein [Streptacidiphilus sp. PB12-B1b]
MNQSTQYGIGARVHCQDEDCGRLDRVVIDPVGKRLTHLVVDPRHGQGNKRLVPIDLVDPAATTADDVRLRCSLDGFEALDPAEETDFAPGTGELGYEPEQMVSLPYYGLGAGGVGIGDPGLMSPLNPAPVVYDRVPAGEVQIRRGDRIEATDGEIGKVKGLVVDPQDGGVTHVLLAEGHLWGRKTVAVPIRSVTCAAGGVTVALTKKELEDLPPVPVEERD